MYNEVFKQRRPDFAQQTPPKKPHRWRFIVPIVLIIVAIIAASIILLSNHKTPAAPVHTGPVPQAISQAVSFKIYYPDQAKLPSGYVLDQNSFQKPVKDGVTYSVIYGNSNKIVFSLQPKPSDNELQSFNGNYIPLRIDYRTPIGQAEIGAYNNHGTTQTLVSLPTNTNTWIIVTAPYEINQDQLKQVLSALK